MIKKYAPKPGSVAARALEHVLGFPIGTEVSGSDICAAIGHDKAAGISPFLDTAVTHGLLACRKDAATRQLFYSLGAPRDVFDADERRGGKPLQRTVKASDKPLKAAPGPSSVFDTGTGTPPPSGFKGWLKREAEKPDSEPAAAPAPKPTVKPPAVKVRRKDGSVQRIPRPLEPRLERTHTGPGIACAMFNTGDLVIEVPGQPSLRLSAMQSADLVGYLQRFAAASAA